MKKKKAYKGLFLLLAAVQLFDLTLNGASFTGIFLLKKNRTVSTNISRPQKILGIPFISSCSLKAIVMPDMILILGMLPVLFFMKKKKAYKGLFLSRRLHKSMPYKDHFRPAKAAHDDSHQDSR